MSNYKIASSSSLTFFQQMRDKDCLLSKTFFAPTFLALRIIYEQKPLFVSPLLTSVQRIDLNTCFHVRNRPLHPASATFDQLKTKYPHYSSPSLKLR